MLTLDLMKLHAAAVARDLWAAEAYAAKLGDVEMIGFLAVLHEQMARGLKALAAATGHAPETILPAGGTSKPPARSASTGA